MEYTLNYYLNQVLEDCVTFGPSYQCYYYLNRENQAFIAYSLEKEDIIYIDEITRSTTLFDLFCYLIAIDLYQQKHYSPGAVVTIACRNISGLTQEKFANALGISVRTLQQWEQGVRKINLENILAVCKFIKIDYNTFFTAYEHAQNSNIIIHKN